MAIQGIDCSNNNGLVKWDQVATAGITFAVIKASEGTTFTDSFFPTNWQGSRQAGLVRGAYAFARPSQNSGHDEAAFFLSKIGAAGGLQTDDFLALDLEDDKVDPHADLLAYTLDFLETCQRALGFKPFLYSTATYLGTHRCLDAKLADYGLWLASPGEPNPAVPKPWTFAAMVQYDWHGRVPGVFGECLRDQFNGTLNQLRQYGWGRLLDPLAGKLVEGVPDITLTDKGAALDATAAAQAIARDLEQARRLYVTRGTALDALLATAQADAAAIALISGLQS